MVGRKLKEWTGATLQEYSSSGHKLDIFGVTSTGISIYIEIIWSSSRANFFRDMNMIQTSDADIKLVVVSPEILNKAEFQREFEKVAISQRRLNIAMHGDLVDGRRILKEPDYLETDFRNIVFHLLNQVKIRGKSIGLQAELEPPEPHSVAEVEEHLVSNLFPVEGYPERIFVSSTTIRSVREAYRRLGSKVGEIPFLPKNKKLYTFGDLRAPSSPFISLISNDDIAEERASDWIQDITKRNDLIYLFNLGLKKYCEKRGLSYDRRHRRFICLLDDGGTNFFTWKPKTKWVTRRIAECVKGKEGGILYCKHYAAKLRFMFLDDGVFLRIEPTMTFTYDGHRRIRSPKLATLMSRYISKQYNSEYLNSVRFWAKWLSKLDATIHIPVGKQSIEVCTSPVSARASVGISRAGF
jgi:hypothetical protein